jgi:hypothetical protein
MKTILFALSLACACGASANGARDTLYKAPPATLLSTAKSVTEAEHYKIVKLDEGANHLETEAIWYTPDGQTDSTTGNNVSRLQNDSINIAFAIDVKPAADAARVIVTPAIHRLHGLSSLPESVELEDPSLPGWVGGKTRALQSKVHDALARYATSAAK